ncbi:AKNA factor, partial [Corythaixoides concolor]|nr:AKNA factor [Corythaixoides concolor]
TRCHRVPSPQDDYHKLLTKYAEAENTIDQLRLGARVSLYADPPQPSRSLTVGTVGTGCRVVALSIPQARTAAFSTLPAPPSSLGGAPGPSEQVGSPQPPSPPPPGGGCPTCPGLCRCPGTQLAQTLRGQTHKLQAQARPGGGWIQVGSPTPQEQLQRFRKLKDAQDALERAYLRARQQHPGVSGDFDPDRAVEGEIFRLGLRLEELKERLEPGGGRQLPPNPVLMEGPQGTVGDSEAVTRGLPQPLWHKQLRVEEDFGDLLAQYQHFKSLPESLSLEQLSLAESESQEEADGPAARDSGPSNVPCRTRSLEEGADLETFPSHPPERRATPLPPREPPWPGGTRGCLSPATAEEPLVTAKPHLQLPDPPQVPLSRHSSRVGSAAPQHQPRKVSESPETASLHLPAPPDPAWGGSWTCSAPILLFPMHLQEQRIVSPETDSGFVGSEASRVSPPVQTPEHQPSSTGTPGSLGPSIPVPTTLRPLWKRDATPLPSEPALMGIYPVGGQEGTGGPRLPPSTPSQSSSPTRWAGSAGSEVGPDEAPTSLPGGGISRLSTPPTSAHRAPPSSPAHTNSEAEGRSCASTSSHPPAMARDPASTPLSPDPPSPTLLSPDPLSLGSTRCNLLGSRLERDQAIRALRDEVWRLRRRLEESLHPSRTYPQGKATPARRQPVASGPSSPKDTAPSGELSPPARGRAAPGVAPMRRRRSASVPRDRPELDLTSESDPSPAGPRATPSPRKSSGSPPGVVTFRGQYTGTRYQVGTPRTAPAPREEPGTLGCPQCHGSRTRSAGFWAGDATGQPQHSTPRRTRCPTCQAPMGPPTPGGRDGATH